MTRDLFAAENPDPHITILPPRPLKLSVEQTSARIRSIISGFPPFPVELDEVRRFPNTDVIYLAISRGDARVRGLHKALNTGDLAYTEEFEFQPHLTLRRPLPAESAHDTERRLQQAWISSGCPRRFDVDHLVFLWLASDCSAQQDWRRLWVQPLGSSAVAVSAQTS